MIMNTQNLSSLATHVVSQRLGELAGEERHVQVEFLFYLGELDQRRGYLELGFGSLWDYCLRSLHLREGAAGRRIGAMRVLCRFPKLAAALLDGRLCLSTITLLGQVLTEQNVDELLARAAYLTKAKVDQLVASLAPRRAPKPGIRKLPDPSGPVSESTPLSEEASAQPAPVELPPPAGSEFALANEAPRPRAGELRATSEGLYSLRATVDHKCKEDLDELTMLLSHKLPGKDLSAVLHEAIRCGLEKHGKRKGAISPTRKRRPKAEPSKAPVTITAEVRRTVWQRDSGCCTWKGPDGLRCGSRWQVEIDHIRPHSQGGTTVPENLRLLCRSHNTLHAEQVYGREFMDRFRRDARTIAGDSDPPLTETATMTRGERPFQAGQLIVSWGRSRH